MQFTVFSSHALDKIRSNMFPVQIERSLLGFTYKYKYCNCQSEFTYILDVRYFN